MPALAEQEWRKKRLSQFANQTAQSKNGPVPDSLLTSRQVNKKCGWVKREVLGTLTFCPC